MMVLGMTLAVAAAFSFCIFRVSKFKIKVVPLHPS